MKSSQVIVQTGVEGQRYAVHAHVEKNESPYSGITLRVTSTYQDSRKPNEHRTLLKQHFQTQAEFDGFVSFLEQFAFLGERVSPLKIEPQQHALQIRG